MAFFTDTDCDDDRNSRFATHSEAMSEYARNIGDEYADHAWLLTSYDVWVRNPHYTGPAVSHPEDAAYDELCAEHEAEMIAAFGPYVSNPNVQFNDEIPF